MIICGESPLDDDGKAYLRYLKKRFGLPIDYEKSVSELSLHNWDILRMTSAGNWLRPLDSNQPHSRLTAERAHLEC